MAWMGVAGMLMGAVVILTVFSFITIVNWTESRRKERESFYRTELLKQLTQQPGPAADRVAEMLREEDRRAEARRREGLKLGGLITTAVGVGIMVFLRLQVGDEEVYLAGLIPLLVGVTMLVYAYVLAPKPDQSA
ncbi:MAG: hypothetical protein AB1806_14765 [Acidobacteriota bacterium]